MTNRAVKDNMTERQSEGDRILEDLMKTGFPFEIETARTFRRAGWDILHQGYYEDSDENHNTIDLSASKLETYPAGTLPSRLGLTVIIECKKRTDKPWAFYLSTPFQDRELASLQYVLSNSKELDEKEAFRIKRQSHYFDRTEKYSVLALEPFSNGSNKEINKAIRQVTSASLFSVKNTGEMLAKSRLPLIRGGLWIVYPAIIYDGELFAIWDDQHGTAHADPIDHVIHAHNYGEKSLFIDIMTKSYVETFARRVLQEKDWLSGSISR